MDTIVMNLLTPQLKKCNVERNTLPKQEQKTDKAFEKTMNKVTSSKGKVEHSKTSSRKEREDIKTTSKQKTTPQEGTKDSLKDVQILGKKESVISKEGKDEATTVGDSILNQVINEDELRSLLNDLDLEQVMQLLPIIGTIMQQLDVPLKQVLETMQQMGIDSQALAEPQILGTFISNLYGTDIESLLINSEQLKDVNKLLEKIQHITENVNLSDMQVAIEKMVIGNNVITETSKMTTLESTETQNTAAEQNVLPIKGITEQVDTLKKDVKFSNEISMTSEDGTKGIGSSSIGIQIPIEVIEQSNQAKLWHAPSKPFSSMETMKAVDIQSQIIEKFQLSTLREGKEITMELSPKELGKLTMKLTEHQGMLTASFKVENEKTKEMLMQNMAQLKTNLEEQGLTVGQFEVNVREESHKFEMEKQKQKSSKRIGELLDKHLQEIEGEPEEVEDSFKENEIDYMA